MHFDDSSEFVSFILAKGFGILKRSPSPVPSRSSGSLHLDDSLEGSHVQLVFVHK